MTRTNIQSRSPYGRQIGFSRAVRIGKFIAVSGTAPLGHDGKPAFPGDPYNQAKYCLEIIREAIEDCGGKMFNVIRTRVFLTDIANWEEVARAHKEVFDDIRPACTFVEVKGLIEENWLVEIEADCIVE